MYFTEVEIRKLCRIYGLSEDKDREGSISVSLVYFKTSGVLQSSEEVNLKMVFGTQSNSHIAFSTFVSDTLLCKQNTYHSGFPCYSTPILLKLSALPF